MSENSSNITRFYIIASEFSLNDPFYFAKQAIELYSNVLLNAQGNYNFRVEDIEGNMADLIWTDEFVIGNEKIAQQHETLFKLVNEFLASLRNGRTRKEIDKVFNSLATYTQTHFTDEKNLFLNIKYPHSKHHIQEHRALTQKVTELKSNYDSGKAFMSLSVFSFLRDWLKHHIIETDKKISPFIN